MRSALFIRLRSLASVVLMACVTRECWHRLSLSRFRLPSVVEKACRYAVGIISGHPFLDGNKRTGAALLGTYLRMCGVGFTPDHAEFLSVMLGVADGAVCYEGLVKWVGVEVA